MSYENSYSAKEDSYLLISSIILKKGESFLDIGTGSGIIALHAYYNSAKIVMGVDIDPKSIKEAYENSKSNKAKVIFAIADLLPCTKMAWDVVSFNPPYLPKDELVDKSDKWCIGGNAGYEIIEKFLSQLQEFRFGRAYFIYSSRAVPSFSKFNLEFKVISNLPLEFETLYAVMAMKSH
ncbi:MAG: 50S ribosomal protein L11 methyltransferase [Thermoplasmata archaeon]